MPPTVILLLICLPACLMSAETMDPADPAFAQSFTSEVRRIDVGRTLHFPNGDPSAPRMESTSRISLEVSWPATVTVVRLKGDPQLTEAVTDTGENLIPPKKKRNSDDTFASFDEHFTSSNISERFTSVHMSSNHFGVGGSQDRVDNLSVQIPFACPDKPATMIKTFKATLRVLCETKPGQTLEVSDPAAKIDKKLVLPGSDKTLTITDFDDKALTYELDADRDGLIKTVEIVTSKGKVVPLFGNSSKIANDSFSYTMRAMGERKIPTDASIRVVCRGPTAVVEVPIELHDVPLTVAPSADGK